MVRTSERRTNTWRNASRTFSTGNGNLRRCPCRGVAAAAHERPPKMVGDLRNWRTRWITFRQPSTSVWDGTIRARIPRMKKRGSEFTRWIEGKDIWWTLWSRGGIRRVFWNSLWNLRPWIREASSRFDRIYCTVKHNQFMQCLPWNYKMEITFMLIF